MGKTSSAASLAVKFAAAGHSTLVVSTDPAHSLSDALDQVPLSCNAEVSEQTSERKAMNRKQVLPTNPPHSLSDALDQVIRLRTVPF